MDGIIARNKATEIRRLLRYLRPYTPLLALGNRLLIAIMALVDGLIAFWHQASPRRRFEPPLHIANAGAVHDSATRTASSISIPSCLTGFITSGPSSVSLFFYFSDQGRRGIFWQQLIQYVGLSGVTDLRNRRVQQNRAAAGGFLSRQSRRPRDVGGHQRHRADSQRVLGLAGGFFPPDIRIHCVHRGFADD